MICGSVMPRDDLVVPVPACWGQVAQPGGDDLWANPIVTKYKQMHARAHPVIANNRSELIVLTRFANSQ